MLNLPETVILPLKMDDHGSIRVSNTRVTLDSLIASYHQGATPEEIHENFDVVPLTDVYAVIAYYLANRDTLDEYLRQRDEEGKRIRKEWEARYTPEQRASTKKFKHLAEEKRNGKKP
ncbi:MAG: DUF433 domain-containing protein [Chloroflexi bacterium]|nr:DUF433 domain-containing protein [Chloroflexota bacterium]